MKNNKDKKQINKYLKLILLIIIFCAIYFVISRTYSKYYNSYDQDTNGDIENWHILLDGVNINTNRDFTKQVKLDIDKYADRKDDVLVPGSTATTSFNIDYSYTEVPFQYTISIKDPGDSNYTFKTTLVNSDSTSSAGVTTYNYTEKLEINILESEFNAKSVLTMNFPQKDYTINFDWTNSYEDKCDYYIEFTPDASLWTLIDGYYHFENTFTISYQTEYNENTNAVISSMYIGDTRFKNDTYVEIDDFKIIGYTITNGDGTSHTVKLSDGETEITNLINPKEMNDPTKMNFSIKFNLCWYDTNNNVVTALDGNIIKDDVLDNYHDVLTIKDKENNYAIDDYTNIPFFVTVQQITPTDYWNNILKTATYSPDQSTTNKTIGIDMYGNPVNMDNWTDKVTGTETTSGYIGEIKDGTIVGEIPMYVKTSSDTDFKLITSLQYTFNGLKGLNTLPCLPSSITDLSYAFYSLDETTNLDLSNWNTSHVTNMTGMFFLSNTLEAINLDNFDTSNVNTMDDMFYDCSSLKSLDLSSFNTKNTTKMQYMFGFCMKLTSIDLSSFDTSNVTDLSFMFSQCKALESIDISNFDTSNATNIATMFQCCESLKTLDLSNFDTSKVTDMSSLFNSCKALTNLNISSFNTSNVTDMSMMFQCCSSLTSLNLSNFNTSKVTDMVSMFQGLEKITTLDLSNFNTNKIKYMDKMFYNSTSLTKIIVGSNWKEADSNTDMFTNCGTSSVTKK